MDLSKYNTQQLNQLKKDIDKELKARRKEDVKRAQRELKEVADKYGIALSESRFRRGRAPRQETRRQDPFSSSRRQLPGLVRSRPQAPVGEGLGVERQVPGRTARVLSGMRPPPSGLGGCLRERRPHRERCGFFVGLRLCLSRVGENRIRADSAAGPLRAPTRGWARRFPLDRVPGRPSGVGLGRVFRGCAEFGRESPRRIRPGWLFARLP